MTLPITSMLFHLNMYKEQVLGQDVSVQMSILQSIAEQSGIDPDLYITINLGIYPMYFMEGAVQFLGVGIEDDLVLALVMINGYVQLEIVELNDLHNYSISERSYIFETEGFNTPSIVRLFNEYRMACMS